MKKNKFIVSIALVMLLLCPGGCSNPNFFTDFVKKTPLFQQGMSEKERIEKELKETITYYEKLLQQYKEAKEQTAKDIKELQQQITVLKEKIEQLKKSLEQWIP